MPEVCTLEELELELGRESYLLDRDGCSAVLVSACAWSKRLVLRSSRDRSLFTKLYRAGLRSCRSARRKLASSVSESSNTSCGFGDRGGWATES